MSNVTDKTAITPDAADVVYVVDTSDTTDNASGSDKKSTVDNLLSVNDARTKTLTNTTLDSGGTGNSVTVTEADISDLSHTPEGTAILSTGEVGGNKFLREDGDGTSSWQTIPGGGDMLASTYDTDSDGRVDKAEEVNIQVYNNTGSTITKGSVVYVSGFNVGQTLPEISLAQANSASTMPSIGIVEADITNATSGFVENIGLLSGLNTSSYSEGDALYVDAASAGALTSTKPTGSNLIQRVATVTRSNVSNGTIAVSGSSEYQQAPNLTAADKYWYGGTGGVLTEGDITAAGRAILDDADAAAQRTTLDVDQAGTDNAPSATTTTPGKVELATQTETNTGTDTLRAVTPSTLANYTGLGATTLDGLTDVDTDKSKTPADGDVLTYDGTDWNAEAAAAGGGGGNPLSADLVVAPSGGDHTTLGAAIAAATAGDVIFVEKGSYAESAQTVSTADLTIIGASKTECIIDINANDWTFSGANMHFERLTLRTSTGTYAWSGVNNQYRNIHFDIDGNAGTVIQPNGADFKITDCYFTSTSTTSSTRIIRSFSNGDNGVISNNHFNLTDATFTGLALFLTGSNCLISNNYFENAAAGGTAIYCGGNDNVNGNEIILFTTGINQQGIRSVVMNNHISSATTGVQADSSNASCMNNDFFSCTTGVNVVSGTDNNSIIGNNFDGGTTGVDITASTCDKNIVSFNSFRFVTTDISDSGTGSVTTPNATI